MKTSLILSILAIVLVSGALASAEMKPLSDSQMDLITAGTAFDDRGIIVGRTGTSDGTVVVVPFDDRGGNIAVKNKFGNIGVKQSVNGESGADIVDNVVKGLNNVITADTTTNSVHVDNSVNSMEMGGDAMHDVRAVSVITGVSNKVGIGLNANASIDRGLGDLSRGSKGLSSGASVPSMLNQSNIIIVK